MMLIEVYSCLAFKAAKAKKGSGFSAAGYSHAVSLCVYIYTLALPTGQDGRELLDCFVHTLGPLMGLWPKRGPIVTILLLLTVCGTPLQPSALHLAM